MLTYELKQKTNGLALYLFFPEKTGRPGIVSIDIRTGETDLVEKSPDDFGNRYAYKLIHRLETFFEQKALPENGVVAWY